MRGRQRSTALSAPPHGSTPDGSAAAAPPADALPSDRLPEHALAPTDFPVFAVREWASRLYAQERLAREGSLWRLGWPFLLAAALGVGAGAVARRWPLGTDDVALGATVVLAAVAVGLVLGGLVRWVQVRRHRAALAARPATVDDLPRAAREAVLATPRLRFRSPADQPGFRAACDAVAALAPMGAFAAAVLVWALTIQGRVDGSLDDWLRGRAG